jgi:hypothetical protein
MIALQCTRKVLTRLRLVARHPEPGAPTNALGHWYVNLLRFGRQEVVMATSDRSLLTVILPGGPGLRERLLPELCETTYRLLLAIDAGPELSRREVEAMSPAVWANTTNRSTLSSMNDFALALDWYLADGLPAMEIMLRFADTPKSALGARKSDYGRPAATSLTLLRMRAEEGAQHAI